MIAEIKHMMFENILNINPFIPSGLASQLRGV